MKTHILGFPRIGSQRELKFAVESFWKGEQSEAQLQTVADTLKQTHWGIQRDAGFDTVATGDFSLYDHLLDTAVMLGAIPPRFQSLEPGALSTYFTMARGDAAQGIPPMEMTKWFDTNYHYIVPEFTHGMQFKLSSNRLQQDTRQAQEAGFSPKPVVVGPLTFLQLGKELDSCNRWDYLDDLLPVYEELIRQLSQHCDIIQIDEPIFCTELSPDVSALAQKVYTQLSRAAGSTHLMLATYFESCDHNLDWIADLPVDSLHLDLVRAPAQLPEVLARWPAQKGLSLGIVDGRNIWKSDLLQIIELLQPALTHRDPNTLWFGSSCSLLHCPVNLETETELDPELRNWMAFAVQKCSEIDVLARLQNGDDCSEELRQNSAAIEHRRTSSLTYNPTVRTRVETIKPDHLKRHHPFSVRSAIQQPLLNLPLFPTTTIGSFPQTAEIRRSRKAHRQGTCSEATYRKAMEQEICQVIKEQEQLGLDVLVHGEPERNDMVEYFGQQLDGFCFTQQGWVQSYGSRCVKPPIIYGDVSRPKPMTLDWIQFAQQQTDKPVKGMLTGPVTILCWSFVRNDLPRRVVCQQIAWAIRDELLDLEAAGTRIIQIDEAALREGMPLKASDEQAYLQWAVDCFRLASCGVQDQTQIHTHMCYSEFNAIAEAIAAMDADVISIEASRSGMELLQAFETSPYPNDIGPGVWDIHSPRVPSEEEIFDLLQRARNVIPDDRLWVNPDCGLKTRAWPETKASLQNMVAATQRLRALTH
ncbi:MAG: 5-methyltetrahydropteroyltriglutamate--homocysteine S-methyltransferase [Pontiella sp.]